jgi:hypothetical protein
MDSLHIGPDNFANIETLNVAYNNIPANHLNHLQHLTKLKNLDLASNDLITLPEDLSFLKSLEDLNLSSNMFSSNSTLIKPQSLIVSMASIPRLKKLNLSRNKFSGFHHEDLTQGAFPNLQELDFSYNRVEDEDMMMATSMLGTFQVLIISGNPFAQQGPEAYARLEHELQLNLSAVIVNHNSYSAQPYLKRKTIPNDHAMVPYPKPLTLLSRENQKDPKADFMNAEMNHGLALPMSDIRPNTNQENEIFP